MVRTDETKSQIAKFCRQRNAIIKRAKEICTLCASKVAIIFFSIGGQISTFGDETIIDSYEEENAAHGCTLKCAIHKSPRIFKLQSWKNKNKKSLDSGCKKKGENNVVTTPINSNINFDEFIKKLNLPQLQQLREKMDGFKENLAQQMYQLSRTEQKVVEASTISKDWLKL